MQNVKKRIYTQYIIRTFLQIFQDKNLLVKFLIEHEIYTKVCR